MRRIFQLEPIAGHGTVTWDGDDSGLAGAVSIEASPGVHRGVEAVLRPGSRTWYAGDLGAFEGFDPSKLRHVEEGLRSLAFGRDAILRSAPVAMEPTPISHAIEKGASDEGDVLRTDASADGIHLQHASAEGGLDPIAAGQRVAEFVNGTVGAEVSPIAKGGPYIGPHGGKWADPEHTVHWEPNTPDNFHKHEPLSRMVLKDGTAVRIMPPYDGRDFITGNREDAVVFGARREDDGKSLGYVLMTRDHGSNEWHVGQAAVDPKHQRQGLNSRLMDAAYEWVKSKGETFHSGWITSNEAEAYFAKLHRNGQAVRNGDTYERIGPVTAPSETRSSSEQGPDKE